MGKPPFHPGDKVKEYVVEQELNVGNMGAVYTIEKRDILLKAPFIDSGKVLIEQFRKEVSTLQTLAHQGILGIIDHDLQSGVPWCSLERLPEGTLRRMLEQRGKLSVVEATRIVFYVAQALGCGHTLEPSVLHRHLRPENIAFKNNRPILLDFGLASFGSSSGITLPPQADILYMAPEQLDIRGKSDSKSEVYTLGVIFYEMLTGHPPFGKIEEVYHEENRANILEQILDPSISAPPIEELEERLQQILEKTLQKNKAQRYATASEMGIELKEVLKDLLYLESQKYEQNSDFQQAITLVEEAVELGLPSYYLENIHQQQEARQKNLLGSLQEDGSKFRKSLQSVNELLLLYGKESLEEKRKKIEKVLFDSLQVQDGKSWQSLLDDVSRLFQGIDSFAPAELKRTPIVPPEKKIEEAPLETALPERVQQPIQEHEAEEMDPYEEEVSDVYDGEVPEEEAKAAETEAEEGMAAARAEHEVIEEVFNGAKAEPKPRPSEEVPFDEDDLPTTLMPKVDFDDVMEKKEPPAFFNTSDDIRPSLPVPVDSPASLKTSDYVVILEQSTPVSETPSRPVKVEKPVLPKGFRWIDDHTAFCEKDESEMIFIPAGTFIMGSEFIHAFDVEKPEHEIYLDEFLIDKHPITWKQYFKFCKETGYQKPKPPKWGAQENHPVVNISWYDAQEYCIWSGKLLPTEAQWEKSGKGGIWLDGDSCKQKKNMKPRRKYPWGDEAPNAGKVWRANFNAEPVYGKNTGKKSTSPLGAFPEGASPYGVMDMAGNVWEWCRDWFSENYYGASPKENPLGPDQATPSKDEAPSKVLRGGSWYIGTRLLRVTARRRRPTDEKGASCGMRGVAIFKK